MGKDIVYLPCFYQNGSIRYAGEPFLLNAEGVMETFDNNTTETEDLYIKHYVGAPLHSGNKWNNYSIERTVVYGSTSPLFLRSDTIVVFPDSIDIYNKKMKSLLHSPVRYVRVSLASRKIAFSNLAFYHIDSIGNEKKVESVSLLHPLDSTTNGEITDYIFDKYISTGYRRELDNDYFDIDLGREYTVSSVCFAPYSEAGLKKEISYELLYWNNGWQSIATQNGTGKHIVFKNVPKGALFLLKHQNLNDRPGSRLFIYRNNEVNWY